MNLPIARSAAPTEAERQRAREADVKRYIEELIVRSGAVEHWQRVETLARLVNTLEESIVRQKRAIRERRLRLMYLEDDYNDLKRELERMQHPERARQRDEEVSFLGPRPHSPIFDSTPSYSPWMQEQLDRYRAPRQANEPGPAARP